MFPRLQENRLTSVTLEERPLMGALQHLICGHQLGHALQ